MNESSNQPRINTHGIDLEAYQKQRDLFLESLALFKAGQVDAGVAACGYLQSMYFIMPGTRHAIQDRKAAKEFIDGIDKLRHDIVIYKRMRDDSFERGEVMSYLKFSDYEEKVGNPMDELVLKFHEIMHSTGFTK